MSKLLRLILTMIVFVLLLIYAARLLGSAYPGSMDLPLANLGGVPTLLGVRPGVTSYRGALELLRSQQLMRLEVADRVDDVFSQGSMRVILTQSYSDDKVARITLIAAQTSSWGSFGQIVALLGPPESLVVERKFTQSFWDRGQLEFVHEHHLVGFVSMEDPLESVAVNDQSGDIPDNALSWRGFGSIEAYLTAKAQ